MNTSSKWHKFSISDPVERAQWERRACGRQFDKTTTSQSCICWWIKKNQDEEAVQPHETARQPDCWEVSVLYTDYCEYFYSDSCKNTHFSWECHVFATRAQSKWKVWCGQSYKLHMLFGNTFYFPLNSLTV